MPTLTLSTTDLGVPGEEVEGVAGAEGGGVVAGRHQRRQVVVHLLAGHLDVWGSQGKASGSDLGIQGVICLLASQVHVGE